jgi:shikimate dehydrogenase
MSPNVDASLITDPSVFHKDLIVFDVIYNPRETKLMELAKFAGCKTYNGLGMLLYQGAEAFTIWTGLEMPVDLIKEKYFS